MITRLLAISAIMLMAQPGLAQFDAEPPPELVGVDIIEHLDEHVPLDLEFIDDHGKQVTLSDYFHTDKPVILQMGYFRCPMLCDLVLNELMDTLKELDWSAGDKFDVISVSINPEETHELASVKKKAYLLDYNRDGASRGFHFLTGDADDSAQLAEAVGFQYRKQPDGEYAHASALFILTPDGRISRYLYGVRFEPKNMRFALLESSEGKIGSTLDRFILWCHIYDPDANSYVVFALRLMQIGGVVTLLFLGATITILLLKEKGRRNREARRSETEPAQ